MYFSRSTIPFDRDGSRGVQYFKHLGFYAYRMSALDLFCKLTESQLERSERLVGSLVATGLDGLGVPYIQAITLWAIAIGSFVTLVQRVMLVRRELTELSKGEAAA